MSLIWVGIFGAAMVAVGVMVLSVNGLPRALRSRRGGAADPRPEESLRWLDQYAWFGVVLAATGAVTLVAAAPGLVHLAVSTGPVRVTLLYAGLLGLLLVHLSMQVLRHRSRQTPLAQRMERVQANFAEYVPMALILMGFVEYAGAPQTVLHILGVWLVAARLSHAYGLGALGSCNYPRTLGALSTFLIIAILAVAAIVGSFGGFA